MSRVLLKLSGEALGGAKGSGFDYGVFGKLSLEISKVLEAGHVVALVLGGGNLFRGEDAAEWGSERVLGDQMGMLATIMNALAFSAFLGRNEIDNELFCSVDIPGIAKGYRNTDARDSLRNGNVAIFSGGIGNPFFTTDTTACLRAIELGFDLVVKATNVDGVYSADPRIDPSAKKYDKISFKEVVEKNLAVMDQTAILLCRDHKMPIVVCSIEEEENLLKAANGEPIGSLVTDY